MTARDYGRYTLLKRLATGGMAEVFLARQKGLEGFEKLLVIKRILPHLAGDEEFVTMFLNEARIAARFNHPNVVQIYDLGKEEDTYFIAMEYIHGEDLGRVMRTAWAAKAWTPVPVALRIMASACEGLYYAHSKCDERGQPLKVVHRDISPQNVIVSFDGGVKVVDFGIARAADQASTTRAGAIKGKFAYMSPEQASGKAIDQRSDLFAAGLVLYELLTGTRPLKRDSDILTLKAAVDCDIPPPSHVATLPPELDPLVMKALARVPEDRFPDARAFQLAIENLLLEQQWSASSVHVSEFMRQTFSERLAEESRVGAPVVHGAESSSAIPVAPGAPATPGSPRILRPAPERPPPLPHVTGDWDSVNSEPAREASPDAADHECFTEPALQAVDAAPKRRSRELRSPEPASQRQPAAQDPRPATSEPRPKPHARKPTGAQGRAATPAPPRRRPRSVLFAEPDELAREQLARREAELARAAEADAGDDEETTHSHRRADPRRSAAPTASRSRWPAMIAAGLAIGVGAFLFVPGVRERAERVVQALRSAESEPAPASDSLDATKAMLWLDSNVPVEVYLGAEHLGTTPLRARVPAGPLALRLANANLGIERPLALEAPPRGEVHHRESFAVGRVRFRANRECDVYIAGRKVARAPGPPLDYFEGSYTAECRNEPEGLAGRQKITIPRDSKGVVEVSFRLQPM